MTITKFEQSGFIIETSHGFRAAFDIGNKTPIEKLHDIKPVDLLVVSHIHGDHFSPDHIRQLSPKLISLPRECYNVLNPQEHIWADPGMIIADENMHAGKNLWPECTVQTDGSVLENEYIKVTFFHVDHGPNISLPVDNYGFLIECEGQTIYFAGDMFYPSGIDVTNLSVDYAMIPVGTFYTFGPTEALAFAKQFKEIKKLVPMHYANKPEMCDEFINLAKGSFTVDSFV